jgi:hypothetical protein
MAKKDDKDKKPKSKPTPKKKRKVGRPKKRGRKKKYYKKKKKKSTGLQGKKGFGSNVSYNRVRSLLWKEHKNEFSSYQDFISNTVGEDGQKIKGSSIVSKVYAECKSLECSDEDILIIYRQSNEQSPDDEKPQLPSDYYMPRPYWELLTEDLWDGMDERLWVDAPMIITAPTYFLGILGEDRCVDKDNQVTDIVNCDTKKGDKIVLGKKWRFQVFVDSFNVAQAQGIMSSSEEVPHVMFIGKDGENETYWNPITKQWEIELVICTKTEDINSFGFVPSDDVQEIDADLIPEPQVPEEKEEDKKDKEISPVQQAEIKEIEKTGKLSRLELKKKGVMEEVKLYKEIGEKKEMADAIKRLKAINKEIDKIT